MNDLIDFNIKNVALIATFTALVFVATLVFSFGIVATNGFFNLGDSMVYVAALVGGPITGFIAGGFGSSLADVTLGYGQFAPGTFVIKGIEGFVVGLLFISLRNLSKRSIKIIYSLFSILFFSIASILTSPSLFTIVTTLDFSKIPTVFSDYGSYSFDFYLTLYYPDATDILAPHAFTISVSGILFILLSLILIGLLWFSYHKYGEKSNAVLSCSFGGLIIVVGYFLYEVFLLNIPVAEALVEVPFNVTQSLLGISIAIPVITYLHSIGFLKKLDRNSMVANRT